MLLVVSLWYVFQNTKVIHWLVSRWSLKYTTHLQVDHVYHRLVQRDWKIS